MVGGDYYQLLKAKSAVHKLINALMGIGYDQASAVEIVECLVEDAGKDGINTQYLWPALDDVAPIKRDV